MKQKENKIKGILKDKMAGFEPEPPPGVWDSVQQDLTESRRRKRLFYLIPIAAGIAIAMGIGIPLLFERPDSETASSTEEQAVITEKSQENTLAESDVNPDVPRDLREEAYPTSRSHEKQEKNMNEEPVLMADRQEKRNRLEKKVLNDMYEVMEESGQQNGVVVADASLGRAANEPDDQINSGQDREQNITEKLLEADTLPGKVLDNELLEVNEDSLMMLLNPDEAEQVLAKEDAEDHSERWQVGASLSPLYSYRDVSSSDQYRNSIVNNTESARITYSAGMSLGFLQSDRLSFESGLYYSKMGVKIGGASEKNALLNLFEKTPMLADNGGNVSVANSMGTIVDAAGEPALSNYGTGDLRSEVEYSDNLIGSSSSLYGLIQSMGFLEIPFKVRYLLIDKAVKLQLSGGVSTNILLNSNASLENESSNVDLGEIRDLRTLNYSGNAGLGIIYDIAENVSLLLEPSFRYHLNSINAGTLLATRPYAFGFFTGLTYDF